jgi:uncharacterized protein YkwD
MRRHARVAVVLAVLAGIAGGTPSAATGGRPTGACRDAMLVPTATNVPRVAAATLCLVNVQRRSQGLRKLRADRELRRAAQLYSSEMVARHFFDHVDPNGSTLSSRVAGTAYLRRARGWCLGENLAWNLPPQATAQATVRTWMNSTEHRIHVLEPRYRDIGIGIASGSPRGDGGPGATYATIFGGRDGAR